MRRAINWLPLTSTVLELVPGVVENYGNKTEMRNLILSPQVLHIHTMNTNEVLGSFFRLSIVYFMYKARHLWSDALVGRVLLR